MSAHTDLSAHIALMRRRYLDATVGYRSMSTDDMTIADVILDDPKRHLDALAQAGVLNKVDLRGFSDGRPRVTSDEPVLCYVIREQAPREQAPHKHNWTVFYAKCTSDRLCLVCNAGDCMETRMVDNHGLFPGVN